ncbi:hypothetical protein [Actinosynnema sp. NPDC023587]|uniref:hypothetical protein n=1 Tax=Actinosynnema sp. NPDC023587 TaxID=3154695 RepID=UPI0033C86360
MLCASGRPLRLITWLALPFLFGSAVLGLTGLSGLLVGAPHDIALSSPLFGAAVAVGAAGSGMVAWHAPWQRTWLRWGYLGGLLGVGVAVDGVRFPVVAVVAVGVPVVALLLVQYVVEKRRSAETTDEHITTGDQCR